MNYGDQERAEAKASITISDMLHEFPRHRWAALLVKVYHAAQSRRTPEQRINDEAERDRLARALEALDEQLQ
jgi:hypothetical protein